MVPRFIERATLDRAYPRKFDTVYKKVIKLKALVSRFLIVLGIVAVRI